MRTCLGAAIKNWSVVTQLGARDFATAAGVSLAHQYRIEAGERSPDAMYLLKLSTRLDISLDQLCNGPANGQEIMTKAALSTEDLAMRDGISKWIRYWSIVKNRKTVEVAKAGGVSVSVQYRIEAGETTPDVLYLIKVSSFFELTLDQLCGLTTTIDVQNGNVVDQSAFVLSEKLNAIRTIKTQIEAMETSIEDKLRAVAINN